MDFGTFEKNYYSLPKAYVNQKVLVFPWEGKLKVYEEKTLKHIYTHTQLNRCKGLYEFDPKHYHSLEVKDHGYLQYLLFTFQREGEAIRAIAKKILARYKIFSIRRFWILRGLINKYGPKRVNNLATISGSLGGLLYNLLDQAIS